MEINSHKYHTHSSSASKLSKLEALIGFKIRAVNNGGFVSAVKDTASIATRDSEYEPIALLIQIGCQKNAVIKLLVFLYASLQYRYLKYRVSRIRDANMMAYGVYPLVESPFAVYQLATPAETYANSNILPVVAQGIKGSVFQALSSIAQCHISTAGIVILIYNNHDTD